MIKLTVVRERWIEPKSKKKLGHSERYHEAIYLNPTLVQYVTAVPTPDDGVVSAYDKGTTGVDRPVTEIGFGVDMAFQVAETVNQVLTMLPAYAYGELSDTENVTIWVRDIGTLDDPAWVVCAKGDPGAHAAIVQPPEA